MAGMDNDYRMYLEEKFKGVHKQMDRIEDKQKEQDEFIKNHYKSCPYGMRVEKMENDLLEYKFIKKYPKAGIAILSVSVILFVSSLFISVKTLERLNQIEKSKTEIVLNDKK